LVLAAEVLARPRLGVDRMNLAVWDASDAVRRDASADECRELPLPGADAEKLVVRELACLVLGVLTSDESADPAAGPWLLAALRLAWAAQGRPGAGLSAAQSFAVQAAADDLAVLVLPAVELGLECSGLGFGRQVASQNSLREPMECELPEELQAWSAQWMLALPRAVAAQLE
jgi:hypothetical protein